MATGWEKGVMPALCMVLCPAMARGGLDKACICPLACLPRSGAAASVFQAGMGGRCPWAAFEKPSWDSQGELGNPDFPAETTWSYNRTLPQMEKPERSKLRVKQNQTKPNQTNMNKNSPTHI